MPLWDFEQGLRLQDPKELEQLPYVQTFFKKSSRVADKAIRTLDTAISEKKPSKASRLIWTRCADIAGNGSRIPSVDLNHLWDAIKRAAGSGDRECGMCLGSIIKWRVSLRDEKWFCNKNDTPWTDPVTGKIVYWTGYWLNENFILKPQIPKS
jgi:hypothetical protein